MLQSPKDYMAFISPQSEFNTHGTYWMVTHSGYKAGQVVLLQSGQFEERGG